MDEFNEFIKSLSQSELDRETVGARALAEGLIAFIDLLNNADKKILSDEGTQAIQSIKDYIHDSELPGYLNDCIESGVINHYEFKL